MKHIDDLKFHVRQFANSNFFVKTILGLVIWVLAFIPAYFYFLVRWLIGPETFWQEFAIFCIFLISIGWIQGLMAFVAVVLTLILIFEEV